MISCRQCLCVEFSFLGCWRNSESSCINIITITTSTSPSTLPSTGVIVPAPITRASRKIPRQHAQILPGAVTNAPAHRCNTRARTATRAGATKIPPAHPITRLPNYPGHITHSSICSQPASVRRCFLAQVRYQQHQQPVHQERLQG